MLSHAVGTHDTRCTADCCNSWKNNAKHRHHEQTVYRHHRVAGMGGLGPSAAKVDVWPGKEKIKGCHGAVLNHDTGTTLWVELTISNWQKDISPVLPSQPFSLSPKPTQPIQIQKGNKWVVFFVLK